VAKVVMVAMVVEEAAWASIEVLAASPVHPEALPGEEAGAMQGMRSLLRLIILTTKLLEDCCLSDLLKHQRKSRFGAARELAFWLIFGH
jgi:hypothetical protein